MSYIEKLKNTYPFIKAEEIVEKKCPADLGLNDSLALGSEECEFDCDACWGQDRKSRGAVTIKVSYKADIDHMEKICVGDWIDLRTAEDVVMVAGDYKLISLGVAIKLPAGYEAIVAPRSSTPKKWGIMLANSIGIIDESYCGDEDVWRFPAIAFRSTTIPKNTRIAQFRLLEHQKNIRFMTVDALGGENRGGIGSTGEK